MKKFEMQPNDSRKSFYGKALVLEYRSTRNKYLQSYDTIVAKIDKNNKLHRTWNGYSATTQRHIIAFCDLYNVASGGKKWWLSLPVEKEHGNDMVDLLKECK